MLNSWTLKSIRYAIVLLVLFPAFSLGQDQELNNDVRRDQPKQGPEESSVSDSEMPKVVSYLSGYDIGAYFRTTGIGIDKKLLVQGLRDRLAGKKSKLSPAQVKEVDRKLGEFLHLSAEYELAKRRARGQAAISAFKRLDNVAHIDLGVHYRLSDRSGKGLPKQGETIKISMDAETIDGEFVDMFDGHVQPIQIVVEGRASGALQTLIQLMPAGSNLEAIVPPEHGFGNEPNSHAPAGAYLKVKIKRHE